MTSAPRMTGTCAPGHGRRFATSRAPEMSWQRARQVADALPDDDPDRLAMRIAPRTHLCANTFRWAAELRAIRDSRNCGSCARPPAISGRWPSAMLGQMTELMAQARVSRRAQLASEHEVLLESIGDPDFTLGLWWGPLAIKQETGRVGRHPAVVADRDRHRRRRSRQGQLLFWFAVGVGVGVSRLCTGVARPSRVAGGFRRALAMAREHDLLTFASVVAYKYVSVIQHGLACARRHRVPRDGRSISGCA